MNLSLMSFSFQAEAFNRRLNAGRLCTIALENGIDTLDLMGLEIRLYGIKKLKKAFVENEVHCGCVIETLPFFRGVEKFPQRLEDSFALCEKFGVKSLMIVPGSRDEKACGALRREEILRRAIELYTIAVERGRERGIEILFEALYLTRPISWSQIPNLTLWRIMSC